MFRQGFGEIMATFAIGYEIIIAGVIRVQNRFDRRHTGVANWRGRQAINPVGVPW